MNIVELFARIGLKTDEGKAASFGRVMSNVKLGLIATTAAAATTAFTIRKIASEAMAAAVSFKQFEIETGSSAQELQRWQSVAEQTNQSAESVSAAIKAIVSNQEKIRLGQGDISGYQLLGIDPRQDPFKILEQLREKTKGLTEGMRKNILAQMGVSAGLIQTLNLTKKEFDEMAGRAWIISPQAIETLNQTKSNIDLAARSINYMKAQIAVGLSPQIKKVTKDFQAWMKVNEAGIIETFKKGFKYVTNFVNAIYRAGSVINGAVKNTIGWDNALKGLLGIVVALNSAFLLSPIGIITAGIILLIAILEDLYVYSKGGKSLFGHMMKEIPQLEKTLFGVFGTIKDVLTLLKAMATGDLATIEGITKKWGGFGTIVRKVYGAISDVVKLLKAIATGDEASIDKILKDWGSFGKIIKGAYNTIKDVIELLKAMASGDEAAVEKVLKKWGTFGEIIKNLGGIFDNLLRIKNEVLDVLFNGLVELFPKLEGPLNSLKKLIKFVTSPYKIFSPTDSALEGWKLFKNLIDEVYKACKALKDLLFEDVLDPVFVKDLEQTFANEMKKTELSFTGSIKAVLDKSFAEDPLYNKLKGMDFLGMINTGLSEVNKALSGFSLSPAMGMKQPAAEGGLKIPILGRVPQPAAEGGLKISLSDFNPIRLNGPNRSGDVTQNNNIKVSVTGTDPVATGEATVRAMQREISGASAQLSRNQ